MLKITHPDGMLMGTPSSPVTRDPRIELRQEIARLLGSTVGPSKLTCSHIEKSFAILTRVKRFTALMNLFRWLCCLDPVKVRAKLRVCLMEGKIGEVMGRGK